MNREQSLALFAEGKNAWNAWANGMFVEKKRLQDAATWDVEMSRWEDKARVDFNGHVFEGPVSFHGLVFPGPAMFDQVYFIGEVLFSDAEFYHIASFKNTKFGEMAFFSNATFQFSVLFSNTTFGRVDFSAAKFCTNATFDGATFIENANFTNTTFLKSAVFSNSTFKKSGHFTGSAFSDVNFIRAVFCQIAQFNSTTFEDFAAFSETKFLGGSRGSRKFIRMIDFSAINSKGFFDLNGAEFEQVPDFAQAHFVEAPSLDRIIIGPKARENPTPAATYPPSPHGEPVEPREGGGARGAILRQAQDEDGEQAQDETKGQAPDGKVQQGTILRQAQDEDAGQTKANEAKEIPSRWRHLRRLATQGNDHENEQYFFAEELKSRRGVFDHWVGKNWQNWWAGQAYQCFSDFGRSIIRPLLWWLGGIALYWTALLSAHYSIASARPPFTLGPNGCLLGDSTPWSTALKSAFDNALLLPVFGVSEGQVQEKLCLFGHDTGLKMPNLPPVPIVPDWISLPGTAHTVFSATMIFLILLAIRNKFRIR